jgi:WD40 repeat protein
MQQINSYLAAPERPDDDLKDLEEVRIEGSCKWFARRDTFQQWADPDLEDAPVIYWVSAKPAIGKSVLSAYVINNLTELNLDCSYYFFRYGDKDKSTVSGLLRSLLYQLAIRSIDVREKLLSMIEKGIRFDKDDAKVVWRKLVEPIISKLKSPATRYWVIDALDECADLKVLFPLIASIDPASRIRILMTSRRLPEITEQFADLRRTNYAPQILCEEISFDDTRVDIEFYLERNRAKIHVGHDVQRDSFLKYILEKSEGCFLWVRLVLDELALTWSVQDVQRILDEVPQNMEPLYTRALTIMSSRPKPSRDLARAILMWTVCAIRPLTLSELQEALKFDLDADVPELESAIASLCAQLVHVDKAGRVMIVHLTARTFLVDPKMQSEFCINEKVGHLQLAKVCLQYLCTDEMKAPRARRPKRKHVRKQQHSPLAAYACLAFGEHLRRSTSTNGVVDTLLFTFLEKSVASWIEFVAANRNLSVLTRTANSISAYLQRHTQRSSPLGEYVRLAQPWVIDLHRIVAGFGPNLLTSPSAIHWLIPPFCPKSSAVAANPGSATKGIVVKGLKDEGWNDRLSCIDSHDKQVSSVACGDAFFAVGYNLGSIVLHHNTTCLAWKILEHSSPVRHLLFDGTSKHLVSCGRRDVKIWDIESESILWSFNTTHDILHFTITNHDKTVTLATRGNVIQSWNIESGLPDPIIDWIDRLPFSDEGKFKRPPLTAAFSPDLSLIAVVFRGRSICLYDIEEDDFYGVIGRERDPTSLALGTNTSPSSLVFNANKDSPLLVAAYEDGDLCLFDYEGLKLLKVIEANAQIVACSPDGLTLATGNSAGMVQLLEFESLQLLYRVNAADYGIRYLAFSTDNMRFLDVRGTQCNVWEPPMLSGLAKRDGDSKEPTPLEPVIKEISDGELEVTGIELDESGKYFFVGKSDGTVSIYDVSYGALKKILYRHAYQISVTSIMWGPKENILITGDTASRFIVCILKPDNATAWTVAMKLMDRRLNSVILQILLDPTNELLLVSTEEINTVWNIKTKKLISGRTWQSPSSFIWTNHPINGRYRILVTTTAATIVDWETCKEIVSTCLLQDPEKAFLYHKQGVKNTFSFANDKVLAVEISGLYGERSTTQTFVLKFNELDSDAPFLLPMIDYDVVGKENMHLIGGNGSKLLFLDKSRWVCSVDMDRIDYRSYVRHFPIPSEWQSQQRRLRMGVTVRGDVLFVRVDEVAVISGGLDFEESVTLDCT